MWSSQWGGPTGRGDGSATSPSAVPRREQRGSSHPCVVDPHRTQAPEPRRPRRRAPPSSTPRGQALPVTLYRDNTSRISQDPTGIDDPLSSPYGMSPKQSNGRPRTCRTTLTLKGRIVFSITKRKTLQDRVAKQINQASFFDFRYADRLAPVGRLKRGHMMSRLRFERVTMTVEHNLVVGAR
jgi:hypothetical protein